MATDDAYAHCATLTRDQWAWEFLRRNPQYQSDYRQFITVWRALEADYGAPPHRNFAQWKLDPRAYGPLDGSTSNTLSDVTGDRCIGEDERVLIECWIGAKWGFYKFPLDPQCPGPPGPAELSWRKPPAPEPRPLDDAYRLDIPFDVSLPLPPQLEAAKFRLVSRATELRRAGHPAPLSVASQCAKWTQMLRLLDVAVAGETIGDEHADLLREAQALTQGSYLGILRLGEARTS